MRLGVWRRDGRGLEGMKRGNSGWMGEDMAIWDGMMGMLFAGPVYILDGRGWASRAAVRGKMP